MKQKYIKVVVVKDSVSELVIKHPLAAISCYLRGQFYVRDYECVA